MVKGIRNMFGSIFVVRISVDLTQVVSIRHSNHCLSITPVD